MVQFSPRGKAATAAVSSPGQPARPKGIGLTAIALAAMLMIGLLRQLLQLWGGPPIAVPPDGLSAIPGARFGLALALACGYAAAGLCLWQYWKGRNWARWLVLLWSLATAIQALSFLAEHNLDPAALMGRPLNFFQATLAVVLLYWLNTPAPRAWYRKTSAGAGELIGDRLRGRLCTGLEFHSADVRREPGLDSAVPAATWRLRFEHDAELILRCPWRIVLDDNLAFTNAPASGAASVAAYSTAPAEDKLPPSSVPAPSHSQEEARRLLQNLRVTAVRVGGPRPYRGWANAGNSSDLFVSFEMGIELQTWSPGAPEVGAASVAAYPPAPAASAQWRYSDPGLTVIADQAGVKARHRAAQAEAAAEP